MEHKCRICQIVLLSARKRVIFCRSFLPFKELTDVLGYTPTESDGGSNYVCERCFYMLNRLKKIPFDIYYKNKPDALRQLKFNLLSTLRRPLEVCIKHVYSALNFACVSCFWVGLAGYFLTGWRKVPIGVYTPIGVQYPDRGIISCIFSSQKVENF